MNNNSGFKSSLKYSGSADSVKWQGCVVDDEDEFKRYMGEVVSQRISDSVSSFDFELRALAATGVETQFVENLLNMVPRLKGWEVGEALAECALRDKSNQNVVWPWNTVRDRRTPRASLPGADLVGFYCENQKVVFLFGEVKTSSDKSAPPGVMSGGSGMVWQLEKSATRLDIQLSLLKWLQARCQSQPFRVLYEEAVKRYLASEGKALLIVGVLIRDTSPKEKDLKGRGNALSKKFSDPTQIRLIAWYLPVQITDLPALCQEVTP